MSISVKILMMFMISLKCSSRLLMLMCNNLNSKEGLFSVMLKFLHIFRKSNTYIQLYHCVWVSLFVSDILDCGHIVSFTKFSSLVIKSISSLFVISPCEEQVRQSAWGNLLLFRNVSIDTPERMITHNVVAALWQSCYVSRSHIIIMLYPLKKSEQFYFIRCMQVSHLTLVSVENRGYHY